VIALYGVIHYIVQRRSYPSFAELEQREPTTSTVSWRGPERGEALRHDVPRLGGVDDTYDFVDTQNEKYIRRTSRTRRSRARVDMMYFVRRDGGRAAR
jgi:hypothetical protein